MVVVNYFLFNYKDGFVIIGKGKIICEFFMVLGIDFVGIVLELVDVCY